MISVLIVDDEYLIRSLIRKSVPWSALGLEVVGEAGNGEEALEIIRMERPQIAVVDINMPIMNGLELAQKVQELCLNTRIIFLTGYQNFEYAKLAVTYQAFDYLLKPIDTEELMQVLESLARKIRAEEWEASKQQTAELQLQRDRRVLQEAFLRQLAFGRALGRPTQISEKLQELGIGLEPENLLVIVAEVEAGDGEADNGVYAYALLNMFCELLENQGTFQNICGFPSEDDRAVILCNTSAPGGMQESVQQVYAVLERTARENFPFTALVGVSEVFRDYVRIPEQVLLAMNALCGKFYNAGRPVAFASRQSGELNSVEWYSSILYETLQSSIGAGEWDAGRESIRTAFLQMRKQRVRESFFRTIALGIAAILYSMMEKYHVSRTNGRPPLSEEIAGCVSSEEIEAVLVTAYDCLVHALGEMRKLSKLTVSAREYIRTHYASPGFSLKKIAAGTYASPAYVSSLFKSEMGISVTEYITICRMKRAVEILNQRPGASLTDVSMEVGYADPYYFSKCFKRYYGIAPSKYAADRNWRGPDENP